MTTQLTLAHDLMLLSLDPETGARRATSNIGTALAGALLAELALGGRVDIDAKKRVQVLDPSPTGNPRSDDLLARLIASKPRKAAAWVQKLSRTFTKDLLADLCAAEIVRREERGFIGFDTSRYPQLGGARRDQLLSSLRGVMVTGLTPTDERIPALGALVLAVGLQRRVFPGVKRKDLQRRLDELDRAGWASKAVRDAIQAAQGAAAAGGAVAASG